MGVREGCARNLAHGRARRVQLRDEATRALKSPRVGHIAAEFERLANVLLGRGCGNPAFIPYPLDRVGTQEAPYGPGQNLTTVSSQSRSFARNGLTTYTVSRQQNSDTQGP